MIDIYVKLFALLHGRERGHFYLLMVLIVISGFADTVGIAGILPFLTVIGKPSVIHSNELLAGIYAFTGADSDREFIVILGLALFGAIIASTLIRILTMYAVARFSQMRKYHIGRRMLAGYLAQPYVWFLSRHSAKLSKTVLQEVDQMVGGAMVPAMRILAQAVSLVFMLGLLIAVRPDIALATTAVLGGFYVVTFIFVRRKLMRLGKERLSLNTARFRITSETLGGIKDVKLMGLEERAVRTYQGPTRRLAENIVVEQIVGELPRYVLEALTFGGLILLILYLFYGDAQGGGSMTDALPVLGLFAVAGLRILPTLQQIYHSVTRMRTGRAVLNALHAEMMELRKIEKALPLGQPRDRRLPVTREIALRGAVFAYPGAAQPVLRGLDLAIPVRTTVGIVGGTGAGKTTTVDLLLGLLRCEAGGLFVDGEEVTSERMRAWQNNLGYVPQQIFLSDDTIAANIAFGVPAGEIDMAAVERAARLAELHGFVTGELPDGYATRVGERGVRLSGGQRQRIGIARALYHDPEVLIFDEATSALDNLTERAVMEAVTKLGHAKTIVMVAHRLSTVKGCDEILVLERGKLVGRGSYEDLIAGNETFRRMVEAAG